MKVRELELAAICLDASAQHIQGAASFYFTGKALQEAGLSIALVLLLELLPFFRLRGIDETQHIARNEAKCLIIVFRPALVVSSRSNIFLQQITCARPIQRCGLMYTRTCPIHGSSLHAR